MTRLEKCEILKQKGFTYDPETGKIFNRFGNELSRKNKSGYYVINGSTHFSGGLMNHHYAWYIMYGNVDFDMIDHINRIKTDNRISNLRNVNNQKNTFNTDAKGYSWHKRLNKWRSYICIDYKQIHLGYFNSKEEAIQTYLDAKEKYHII